MTSKYPYPSLEPAGNWETNSYIVADRVFSDFYTCDASQSFLIGTTPSMAHIVSTNQRNLEDMMREIKFAVEEIFGDYFSTVVAEVEHSNAGQSSNKAELTIKVMIVDKMNNEINIGKLFSIEGSKISIVSNLIKG